MYLVTASSEANACSAMCMRHIQKAFVTYKCLWAMPGCLICTWKMFTSELPLSWNHLSYFSLWWCYQRRCAATMSGNRVNHMQVSTQHSSARCVLLFHYCLKHSWVNQPGQCTDMIVKGCVRRAPKKMHVVLQQRRHLRNWVADLITTSWCLLGSFWDSSLLHLGEPTASLL